jgi:hypothetical protein
LPDEPFTFEWHRTDISQRRMQPGLVVPEQPGDAFILSVAPGHEALPVQALDLQRAEQRLAAGIIPTVATPAHRAYDAVLLEDVPVDVTSLLAAPVAVKQHPGVLARMALEQVDDHGQKQPALISGDVCDVADPDFVGLGHGELAVEQVWRDWQFVMTVGGDLEASLALGANAVQLHELLHPLLAHRHAARHPFAPDARGSRAR